MPESYASQPLARRSTPQCTNVPFSRTPSRCSLVLRQMPLEFLRVRIPGHGALPEPVSDQLTRTILPPPNVDRTYSSGSVLCGREPPRRRTGAGR